MNGSLAAEQTRKEIFDEPQIKCYPKGFDAMASRRIISKEEAAVRLLKAFEFSTTQCFTNIYIIGQIEVQLRRCGEKATEMGLYKHQVKQRLNDMQKVIQSLNLDLRILERVRILPTLSHKLKTFTTEYPDVGNVINRVQLSVGKHSEHDFIVLRSMAYNRVNNEVECKNKEFVKELYVLGGLCQAVRSSTEATTDAIKEVWGPKAHLDEPLRNQHTKVSRISDSVNRLCEMFGAREIEGYWYEEHSTAVMHLALNLISDTTTDIVNSELEHSVEDYVWWWVARTVMWYKDKSVTSDSISEDLARAIPRDALHRGRVVCRLKQIARKVGDYEDIHDLIDELQQMHYKDIETFVKMAVCPDSLEHCQKVSIEVAQKRV